MASTKLTIASDEYRKLKAFYDYFVNRFYDVKMVPPEQRPLAVLEEMEKRASSTAAKGLAMAINDCVEEASGWRAEKQAAFNAELAEQGLVTLTELQRQYSRQYSKVMKRGRIDSEEEYYLLKGVLDGASLDMTAPKREALNAILVSYEERDR